MSRIWTCAISSWLPTNIRSTPRAPRSRIFTADYDELGRVTQSDISTDESGGGVGRPYFAVFDDLNGTATRTGPDGTDTFIALDAANRVALVRRYQDTITFLEATYTYYADGLVKKIEYGNTAQTLYFYDEANRVTTIEHQDGVGTTILKMDCDYLANDLVDEIIETDASAVVTTTTFGNDNRNRLTYEKRVQGFARVYEYSYEYDQGGNRTKKIQNLGFTERHETEHTYDISDPATYGTDNIHAPIPEPSPTIQLTRRVCNQ